MKCKLGDICDITSSKRIFANEYCTFGVPFFRGKEIIEKQNGKPVSNELFIEESRYTEIKNKHGVPQNGDLLLTSVGTLGVPYIVQNERFYFKDGNITWFRNFRNASSQFIYYWLLSPFGRQQIDSKSIGSTQKALTIDALLGFDIDLPPLSVQREIAAILSALDAKIANNTAINHNLEQMAQAIYREALIKGDVGVLNDVPFNDDIFRKHVKNHNAKRLFENIDINAFEKVKLGELIKVQTKSGIPVEAAKALGDAGKYRFYTSGKAILSWDKPLVNGENIYLNDGGAADVAYFNGDAAYSTHTLAITSNDTNRLKTLYLYCFLYANIEFINDMLFTGTCLKNLNRKQFLNWEIPLPPIEIQSALEAQVATLEAQVAALEAQNKILSGVRDAILPRLMSGEMSVAGFGDDDYGLSKEEKNA
ncbi:MAG: restriction endonuclease subunit S [Chitinivibrionia bacterium]|nr:restriction endonuclease subunit S [Chitinivibrionia bacterium]